MRMVRTVTVAALAGVAMPLAAWGAEPFRAQGNEPFWSLRRTDDAITFQTMDGAMVTISPVPEENVSDGARTFRADVEGEDFVLTITEKVCTDTMSGMPFPVRVSVTLGADAYDGCGGEPAALLAGDWTVTAVDGAPPVADSEPSLGFEETRVSGNASCNRFFGSYHLTGEGLSVGEMGASMMMCADPVMAQERAMLSILEATTGFAVADDGMLTLHAADGRTLSAKRADP